MNVQLRHGSSSFWVSPPAVPIHAVIPASRIVPARLRAFLDALHEPPLAEARARSTRSL